MSAKVKLRDLLKQECVLAPCIFDCSSARALEMCGYHAMLLSGAELSMSMKGYPDLGLLSLDEALWAVERIADVSPLPLIVDIEDGFGGGALNVYHTCERMARAGAQGLLMEDEAEPGYARDVNLAHILPREDFYAKVRAGVAAVKGTDCMFFARTNSIHDMEEAIARCNAAIDLGADGTVIVGMKTIEEAKEVASRVKGIKMFADINAVLGLPEINVKDLAPLGYNIVTMHYTLKAAMAGMLDYGAHNWADQSNTYSNSQTPAGFPGHSAQPFFTPRKWLDFEEQFTGEHVEYKDPTKGAK